MNKLSIFTIALFFFLSPGAIKADDSEPARKWLVYLEGTWKVSRSGENPREGTATFRRLLDGKAVLGEYKDNGEVTGHELDGWDPIRKIFTVSGFGDRNASHWHLELKPTGEMKWEGDYYTAFPDGRSAKAEFTIYKVDEDHLEWKANGKMSDGSAFTPSAKWERQKER
mgnify:FL=1